MFKKDYLPIQYEEWVARIIDRLKYSNQEAQKNGKLLSIVGADLEDVFTSYFGHNETWFQNEFDATQVALASIFIDGAVPSINNTEAELVSKYIEKAVTNINHTQGTYLSGIDAFYQDDRPVNASSVENEAWSQLSDIELPGPPDTLVAVDSTINEYASLIPHEKQLQQFIAQVSETIATTIHVTTTLTNDATSLASHKTLTSAEIVETISNIFESTFVGVAQNEALQKVKAHFIAGCTDYWLKFQDCNHEPIFMNLRRRFVARDLAEGKMVVLAIANHYKYQEEFIRKQGKLAWIRSRNDMMELMGQAGGKDIVLRAFYDTLVGFKFATFWLELSQQPIENLLDYYKKHKPSSKSLEKMFFDVQKEYNVTEGPEKVIACYKRYCC